MAKANQKEMKHVFFMIALPNIGLENSPPFPSPIIRLSRSEFQIYYFFLIKKGLLKIFPVLDIMIARFQRGGQIEKHPNDQNNGGIRLNAADFDGPIGRS
jgi:hypothetical protein